MQNIFPDTLTRTTLELNLPKPEWELRASRQLRTPAIWFAEKFPDQTKNYGCPFIERRSTSCDGFNFVTPIAPNTDFFAAMLGGDSKLNHSVVYFEPEMQFYYREPVQNMYRPTSPEKLQNYYRAMLLRCAQELNNDSDKFNLFVEFRSDKVAKAVTDRAKSVLAADQSFFSATSHHQRIKGPELHERLARVLVEQMLEQKTDSIVTVRAALLKAGMLEAQAQQSYNQLFFYYKAFQTVFPEDWPVPIQYDSDAQLEQYAENVLKGRRSQLVKTNGFGAIMKIFPPVAQAAAGEYANYLKIISKLKGRISWIPGEGQVQGTGKGFQTQLYRQMEEILF